MSEWDLQALEANFDGWRTERAPNLTPDRAFERYAVEQALRDADLTDEEIESGLVGAQTMAASTEYISLSIAC